MNIRQSQSYQNELKEAAGRLSWEALDGKTLLVTGAAGMIASALVDTVLYYNQETLHPVHIIAAARHRDKLYKRFGAAAQRADFHLYEHDAAEPFTWDGPVDYIIHAASNAVPRQFKADPVGTMLANFNGVYQALTLARMKKSRRVLYISSGEVYGNTERAIKSEGDYGYLDILDVRSCYPSSKRAAETLCAAYRQQYGVDSVIARPSHVYGPTMTIEDDRASSSFLRDAAAGREIVMHSAGDLVRSYTYVFDAVCALFTILCKGQCGEAYNIANETDAVSVKDFAVMAAQAGQGRVVLKTLAEYDAAQEVKITRQVMAGAKLRALGWDAAVSLPEGIRRTLECLKAVKEPREG